MRPKSIGAMGIMGTLAMLPSATLFAIEPPPDNARPPAALLDADKREPGQPAGLPFLGLSTAEVPAIVAEHLGIQGGSGVIVRTVLPDSPAEKAGLGVNDIILSMDGDPVANPDDFSAKIRSRKAGERLELELISKGKPGKAEVTLSERPEGLNADIDQEAMLGGIPEAHAERLRRLFGENLQGFGPDQMGLLPDQNFDNAFRMMRERMNRALGEEMAIPPIRQGKDGGVRFQQNSTIRLMDNQGSVEIRSADGDTQVTVRDKSNKVVWEGPWNTEEDKKAAPEPVRQRIDRVNVGSANGGGLTLRFGNREPQADDTIDN